MKLSRNIANNKHFQNIMRKICAISQNFLPQSKICNLLSKSYYCVMRNTTVNVVNCCKDHFVAIKCIEPP